MGFSPPSALAPPGTRQELHFYGYVVDAVFLAFIHVEPLLPFQLKEAQLSRAVFYQACSSALSAEVERWPKRWLIIFSRFAVDPRVLLLAFHRVYGSCL